MISEWPPNPETLRELLQELRQLDPHLRAFGAAKHRYELNPVVPSSSVAEWEDQHGVNLPHVYRDFLTTYGNGGAGPDYGIFTLTEVAKEFDSECPTALMNRPFEPPLNADEPRDYPTNGVLPLAHAGCGNVHLLITAGVEAGTMWAFLNDNTYEPQSRGVPLYPPQSTVEQRLAANAAFTNEVLRDRSRRLDFWGWYRSWIEQRIASAVRSEPSWFHQVRRLFSNQR